MSIQCAMLFSNGWPNPTRLLAGHLLFSLYILFEVADSDGEGRDGGGSSPLLARFNFSVSRL